MARTTGPILAAGAITWANNTWFERGAEFEFEETARVAVATGMAAAFLAVAERATEPIAMGIAWAALASVILVPVGRANRSPIVNALDFVGLD